MGQISGDKDFHNHHQSNTPMTFPAPSRSAGSEICSGNGRAEARRHVGNEGERKRGLTRRERPDAALIRRSDVQAKSTHVRFKPASDGANARAHVTRRYVLGRSPVPRSDTEEVTYIAMRFRQRVTRMLLPLHIHSCRQRALMEYSSTRGSEGKR